MPNYLDVRPEELRETAKQHDLAAANIRKWGEIPDGWLAGFESSYGKMADPVRASLVDYYNRRHDKAERLAANHERTRDRLIAAAAALEDTDRTNGGDIVRTGDVDREGPPVGPTPGAPPDPVARVDTSPVHDTQPEQPSATTPAAPGMPDETGHPTQVAPPPPASAPQTYDTAPAGASAPTWTTPPTIDIPMTPPTIGIPEPDADIPGTPAVEANNAPDMVSDANNAPGLVGDANDAAGMTGGIGAPLVPGPFAAAVGDAGMARALPTPLATGPFAAAVHVAEDKQTLPSFVVGEQTEDDLVLARTLLAATLAAVADSAHRLEWAVAVLRTPVGPVVVLTSTEGRGWLPPGLFLPSEVLVPWKWVDAALTNAGREAIAAFEGTTDPARMLAEFGRKMRHIGTRISALVSSVAIPDALRAALGANVAVEDWVSAVESAVDFTLPGVGLVDRLALAGSDELLRQAATVPETEIRAKCLELAQAADARVRAAVSSIDAELSTHRALRQRILDALHAGLPIPASWWDQMRAADDTAAATLRSRRVDVSHVPADVRLDLSDTEALRGMVFERRADELLLLLAIGESDRQTLRDAFYTYGQITEHPMFSATASVVATRTAGTTDPGWAVPNVEIARNVGPGAYGVSSVSVNFVDRGGAPSSIADLLRGPAESEGSGEQRRA
ncbi:type VII secretion target [Nocardia sp. GCM10030253]|uniref:type VII secretion target n=1 Tax=Nocardia sp. GCM10030253 TaxID=3273404 RepID=UPI00363B877B